ncbi:MAG: hypothetical protein KBB64_06045 [Bacteroidia bacterium]|jgi:hypothetical protein|nr:hypothetical protein [Bacteroidia bacterium]
MAYLKVFEKNELIFDQEAANKILCWFFNDNQLKTNELTHEDIAFAQGLILEAVDSSNAMGVVHQLMKTFVYKVPSSFSAIRNLVVFFVARSIPIWWKNRNIKNLKELEVYDVIKNSLILAHRSEWHSRVATGEYINKYLK